MNEDSELLTERQLSVLEDAAGAGNEPEHKMLRMLFRHLKALGARPPVPELCKEPARTDLTDRECARLIGAALGGLLQMAEPVQVKRALEWWLSNPQAWGFLVASQAEIRRLLGVAPYSTRQGCPK